MMIFYIFIGSDKNMFSFGDLYEVLLLDFITFLIIFQHIQIKVNF